MKKIFYTGIFIIVSSFSIFLGIIFYSGGIESVKYFFYTVMGDKNYQTAYGTLVKPVLETCFSEKSKLACSLEYHEKPINPSCFIQESALENKVKKGLPKWAKDQIQEDLSKFPVITKRDLDRYFKENIEPNNILVKIKIKDRKVDMTYATPCSAVQNGMGYKHGGRVIRYVLEYLAKNKYIPDTEFIISLADFYRPVGQESLPIFTFCKDLDIPVEKDLILIPDWQNFGSTPDCRKRIRVANKNISWKNKKGVLFWRGGRPDSTGFREKFITFSKKNPLLINAEFIDVYDPVSKARFVPLEEHLHYKYLISIDGYRGSWERLIWHLHSNSLVFKHQSNQIQWFYKGIKPFVHYIPVIDEHSILKNIEWAETHPEAVQKTIYNASNFVENNLLLEDMYYYMIVLLTEYNKRLVD